MLKCQSGVNLRLWVGTQGKVRRITYVVNALVRDLDEPLRKLQARLHVGDSIVQIATVCHFHVFRVIYPGGEGPIEVPILLAVRSLLFQDGNPIPWKGWGLKPFTWLEQKQKLQPGRSSKKSRDPWIPQVICQMKQKEDEPIR